MSVLARKIWLVALTIGMLGSVLATSGLAQRPPGTEEIWLSLYLNDAKIGWAHSRTTANSEKQKVSQGVTQIQASMLGDDLQIRMETSATVNEKGEVLRSTSKTLSGGRTQEVTTVRKGDQIEVRTEFTGQPTSIRTIPLKTDAPWLDNPLDVLADKPENWRGELKVYVFDPTVGDLVANEVIVHGPETISAATLRKIEIRDPRAPTFVYLNPDGSLNHAKGALGIRMVPATEEEAKAQSAGGRLPDLADETRINVKNFPVNPAAYEEITIQFTNADLRRIPSDSQQFVTGSREAWVVRRVPLKPNVERSVSIEVARQRERDWVLPATYIPSDSERMKRVASEVIQGETNAIAASLKLRSYVEQKVGYNAGIGVIRDAAEVLETAEGVCRDHAILLVTLLRAAGIPSKIVGGVVNWGTGFYYHAWVEVFDGQDWIGLDSTSDLEFVTPAHIKFGQGNVDLAFTFNFPTGAIAEVLSTKRREPGRNSHPMAQPRQ
jgi:hypothetical protein